MNEKIADKIALLGAILGVIILDIGMMWCFVLLIQFLLGIKDLWLLISGIVLGLIPSLILVVFMNRFCVFCVKRFVSFYHISFFKTCDACSKPAVWKVKWVKIMRGNFGKEMYYCSTCILEDLNGEHTGGGPFLDCFKSMIQIKEPVHSDLFFTEEKK